MAQAQLVGWLEGLFHGIQAAMFAQQAARRSSKSSVVEACLRRTPSGATGAGPAAAASTSRSTGSDTLDRSARQQLRDQHGHEREDDRDQRDHVGNRLVPGRNSRL